MENTNTFNVIQITDTHLFADPEQALLGVNTCHYFKQVLKLALNNHQDSHLLVLSGDLAQEPTEQAYRNLSSILQQATELPCLCLPGNHDDLPLMQLYLNTGNISCNKQFISDDWQVVTLNSQIIGETGGALEKSELDYMEACISQHPHKKVLICFHHHCIKTGSQWMDSMKIKNSDDLFRRLKKYPQVKAIISGHVHQDIYTELDSIKVYSTPSTCFQFTRMRQDFALDPQPPGYRWLKLHANGLVESSVVRLNIAPEDLEFTSDGY